MHMDVNTVTASWLSVHPASCPKHAGIHFNAPHWTVSHKSSAVREITPTIDIPVSQRNFNQTFYWKTISQCKEFPGVSVGVCLHGATHASWRGLPASSMIRKIKFNRKINQSTGQKISIKIGITRKYAR